MSLNRFIYLAVITAGKALARRTGSACEADASDERSNIFKVQYLYGNGAYVYATGLSVKAGAHYPGRSANLPQGYRGREVAGGAGRNQQRPGKDT